MGFWTKVKKDLSEDVQLGLEETGRIVKEGARRVRVKTSELSDEAQKKYRVYRLKSKVEECLADLGGKVYDLARHGKDPMKDADVKARIEDVKSLELEIKAVEGNSRPRRKARAAA